jgi:Domain of unknown function (DUF4253)
LSDLGVIIVAKDHCGAGGFTCEVGGKERMMARGELPQEGELQLGSVRLPAGTWVRAGFEDRVPVAWVTHQAVPGAGRIWEALSALHPATGLVPFLLGSLSGEPSRPWDSEEFAAPSDPALVGHMDAAEVLAEMWDGEMPSDEEEEEDEYWRQMHAPFSKQFPGLAPTANAPLTSTELNAVLGTLPASRIGLVPAERPADVLPSIGWTPSDQSDALPISTVVRSWEDRFGARLLEVGFAEIRLLATRPPRTLADAQRLAAEQFAFCDECAGQGLHDVPSISEHLLNSPIWTFWWD